MKKALFFIALVGIIISGFFFFGDKNNDEVLIRISDQIYLEKVSGFSVFYNEMQNQRDIEIYEERVSFGIVKEKPIKRFDRDIPEDDLSRLREEAWKEAQQSLKK